MKHTILKKINRLLDAKQKRQLGGLFGLMLIGAILDTMSITLVVPIMYALVGSSEENSTLNQIVQKIIPASGEHYLIVTMLSLIFLFLAKNIFLSFQYYCQEKFINTCKKKTRNLLLRSLLNRPYQYFLKTESGEIIRLLNADMDGTFILIRRVLGMSIEIIVTLCIAIALFIIEPVTSVVMLIMLTAEIAVISLVINPASKRLSKKNKKHAGIANTWIIQTFHGIKEIIVTQKKEYFIKQFNKHSAASLDADAKATFVSSLPRNIIEAVSISGMLTYILLFYLLGNDVSSLIPKLSAFAVAAVRLLPSFNRISMWRNAVAYNEPRLDNVLEAMDNISSEEQPNCSTVGEITFSKNCGLQNVSFAYEGRTAPVLQNVDMDIPTGMSVGIVGASGSGKTTAVDILLGLLSPQTGHVFSDNTDIHANSPEWLDHVGYIPQTIFLLNSSIKENVAFGVEKEDIDEDRIETALRAARLWDFIATLPDGVNTEVGEQGVRLSGGQRQRIGIARALYTDPEILVFDEATSSLDNATEKEIMESINALHGKKTLIIIAHRLSTLEYCDIIYKVENGNIVREK